VVRTYSSGEQDHQQYVALNGDSPFKATMGAVVARGKGLLSPRTGLPNHVLVIPETVDPTVKLDGKLSDVFSLKYVLDHYGAAGSLGRGYEAFVPRGGNAVLENLTLKLPSERFSDRRLLLERFDELRRKVDQAPEIDGIDALRQQA
jgi:hypothetical protein